MAGSWLRKTGKVAGSDRDLLVKQGRSRGEKAELKAYYKGTMAAKLPGLYKKQRH